MTEVIWILWRDSSDIPDRPKVFFQLTRIESQWWLSLIETNSIKTWISGYEESRHQAMACYWCMKASEYSTSIRNYKGDGLLIRIFIIQMLQIDWVKACLFQLDMVHFEVLFFSRDQISCGDRSTTNFSRTRIPPPSFFCSYPSSLSTSVSIISV